MAGPTVAPTASAEPGYAETGLAAWVAGCATLIIWGYGLSALYELASPIGWIFGAAIAGIAAWRTGRAFWPARNVGPRNSRATPVALVILYAGVGVVLVAGALTAFGAAPSNWDSLTYHLARVGYYLQQGSLADFGANYWAQEEHARGGSILLCALFSLCGRSDALYALPQIGGYLAALASIVALARQIGASTVAARATAAAFGLLTIVALEVPTAQDDLLLTGFLGAGLVGAIAYLQRGESRSLFLSAGGFGLAVSVKASALTAGPAVVFVLLGTLGSLRVARSRAWPLVGAVALAIVAVAAPAGYWKNLRRFGHPLGSAHMLDTHLGRSLEMSRARLGVTNAVRFTGDLFTLDGLPEAWGGAFGGSLKTGFGSVIRSLGVDAESAVATRAPFSWSRVRFADENLSFLGWLGVTVLIPGCIGSLLLWRRRPLAAGFALGAAVFLLEQAAAGPYDPWRGRHFIYGALFAAPGAAWLFETHVTWLRRLAWGAAAFGVGAVVPALLWRSPNPLLPRPNAPGLFSLDRLEQMALHHPCYPALKEFERLVPPNATVVVALPENEYEYPLFGSRLSRRLIPLPRTQLHPELLDTADFLLLDHRLRPDPDAADIPLGYAWRLRPLRLRPADFTSVSGLYAREIGFAWMAAELQLRLAPFPSARWLNLDLGDRLPYLPPAGRITLVIDGLEQHVPLQNGRCAVSLQLAPGREHEVRIASEASAASPQAFGPSSDSRVLSYRVRTLNVTSRPLY